MAVTIDGTNGLTFNNGSTQASAPALTLLATITPTAATTIQSLNLFTSTYDNYLIVYDNIQTASSTGTCTLDMQFAVAGAVVSTSTYNTGTYTGSVGVSTTYMNLQFQAGTLDAAYAPCSGYFYVLDVNSTGTYTFKYAPGAAIMPSTTTPVVGTGAGIMRTSSAITGFSMFLRNGANFVAQGKVRVYGLVNS